MFFDGGTSSGTQISYLRKIPFFGAVCTIFPDGGSNEKAQPCTKSPFRYLKKAGHQKRTSEQKLGLPWGAMLAPVLYFFACGHPSLVSLVVMHTSSTDCWSGDMYFGQEGYRH